MHLALGMHECAFQVVDLQLPNFGICQDGSFAVVLHRACGCACLGVKGNGEDCDVRVTLPLESDRQTIKYERESSESAFKYTISPNRIGRWRAKKFDGKETIHYSFFASPKEKKYTLPEAQAIPREVPETLNSYLVSTDKIQADDPAIRARAFELAPQDVDIATAITKIYEYCYRGITFLKVKGPTDAVTAMKLGEASCNGKNRLMIALLRARGIPARMTNGLILENKRKRTTHAWTEIRVDGQWIPFCPTNGHFAEIPGNYLELAKGDVAVFTHSPHIGFEWNFAVHHTLSHRDEAVRQNAANPLNILSTWTSLKEYHISLDLIAIILMIPIGATVVSFSRNIIGLRPYGTFMPALVGAAFRDTGLLMGAGFFLVIVLVSAGANWGTRSMRLLHIPRLVIVINVVVICILLLPIGWLKLGLNANAAGVSFFPIAILSLTGERFMQTVLEDGFKDAFNRMLITFAIGGVCYAAYNFELLKTLVVAFPELLLVNIAANFVIGSWTGMRLLEWRRFRAAQGQAVEAQG